MKKSTKDIQHVENCRCDKKSETIHLACFMNTDFTEDDKDNKDNN